ncbi:hypothetical protein R6Q57_016186 [Mikania cordata]
MCAQIKQYGMSKDTNEAMFVNEAYRTLHDRGPYPAEQGSDVGVKLYWGIALDGSVVISDDLKILEIIVAISKLELIIVLIMPLLHLPLLGLL